MVHTYANNFIHCIFSTKERLPTISAERTTDLYTYLGGIARSEGFTLVAAGGTANHIHLLLCLPADQALATAVQSSKEVPLAGWAKDSPGSRGTALSA